MMLLNEKRAMQLGTSYQPSPQRTPRGWGTHVVKGSKGGEFDGRMFHNNYTYILYTKDNNKYVLLLTSKITRYITQKSAGSKPQNRRHRPFARWHQAQVGLHLYLASHSGLNSNRTRK